MVARALTICRNEGRTRRVEFRPGPPAAVTQARPLAPPDCWCPSGPGAVLYRWAYCGPAFAVSECDKPRGPRTRDVIICSCNVLTDHDVRSAAKTSSSAESTNAVYRCLGCRAQCGRCARTIRKILRDARLREAPNVQPRPPSGSGLFNPTASV
jgi:bacterioferritin-associated ferredoxin